MHMSCVSKGSKAEIEYFKFCRKGAIEPELSGNHRRPTAAPGHARGFTTWGTTPLWGVVPHKE